jgi:Na+/melibiose symporter-like transporter
VKKMMNWSAVLAKLKTVYNKLGEIFKQATVDLAVFLTMLTLIDAVDFLENKTIVEFFLTLSFYDLFIFISVAVLFFILIENMILQHKESKKQFVQLKQKETQYYLAHFQELKENKKLKIP